MKTDPGGLMADLMEKAKHRLIGKFAMLYKVLKHV